MHGCAACLSCLRLIEEPTWIHVASAVLQSLYKEHRLSFAIILAAGAATRTENLPTFILQIFGVLLLAQAGGEEPALLSGYDGAPLPSHQAHHVRIVHLESTLGDLPGNRPASVTSCADADRHNVKTALLADWSGIKTGHPSTQAIGHGSTARMQHLNPFVYLPQFPP
ncbi:uncharacterized protein LOC119166690 isoform X2 [Rhipicephalus microplus]|uniref:uncharacterized protein LOC119166690 isoform X2 n=1 Tax=Rhipicephalus microplus TaxID=6941 RepID=UPI003F6C13FC